jgi:hypothetical protein
MSTQNKSSYIKEALRQGFRGGTSKLISSEDLTVLF